MADAYKTGDVVQLKSGGPSMTVVEYGEYGMGTRTVLCKWFDRSDVRTGTFLEGELVKEETLTSGGRAAQWG